MLTETKVSAKLLGNFLRYGLQNKHVLITQMIFN